MTDKSEPFLMDGISLGIPNTSATHIEQIDNCIFVDENGELRFKDNYVKNLTDINGNPITSLSLRDLYTRMNGVYVANGKLYFKDSSVSKPYSLNELANAYISWKSKLTTGGVYWIGSNKITEIDCNNIMVNVVGDPNLATNTDGSSGDGRLYEKVSDEYPATATGTKVFSIDKYLNDYVSDDAGDYKTTASGELKWHDVPKHYITIPSIDETKPSIIIAKTNFRLIKSDKPVLVRLYDKTTGIELDRKALGNDTELPVEQQPLLTYFGTLTTFKSQLTQLACQCPTTDQTTGLTEEPPHVIAVQFHVDDQLVSGTDDIFNTVIISGSGGTYSEVNDTSDIRFNAFERRLIGFPNSVSSTPLVNSSIDIIIYDATKSDTVGRKAGNVVFSNIDLKEIVFSTPFSSTEYSINLSCDKNINLWYTNKKTTGFTIRAERKFAGNVDWSVTKLKFEGEA